MEPFNFKKLQGTAGEITAGGRLSAGDDVKTG
jgi:hypothetical protein